MSQALRRDGRFGSGGWMMFSPTNANMGYCLTLACRGESMHDSVDGWSINVAKGDVTGCTSTKSDCLIAWVTGARHIGRLGTGRCLRTGLFNLRTSLQADRSSQATGLKIIWSGSWGCGFTVVVSRLGKENWRQSNGTCLRLLLLAGCEPSAAKLLVPTISGLASRRARDDSTAIRVVYCSCCRRRLSQGSHNFKSNRRPSWSHDRAQMAPPLASRCASDDELL